MSVGQNIKHDSSLSHVTGKSIFIDDRPRHAHELLVLVVGSPIASGEIISIDGRLALKVPGVHSFFTAKDLVHNQWGTIKHDQPLLVDKIVGYKDEPLYLLAGTSYEALNQAKKLVKIKYKESNGIFTMKEARAKSSVIYAANPFMRGDVDAALKKSKHRLQGEFECGGQEHFYMENQAAIAYPMENGQMEVHASSQHPSETQRVVAEACGLSLAQVVCVVKRMGGGFGGKESQAAHFAGLAALVAHKTGRAARLFLTKDDDMQMTGKRHPFEIEYDVGFDDDGKILAFRANIFCDAGAYTDLTPSILERAMFHIDSAYYLPDVLINGWALKTNNHSNTAFRGFGGPQGAFAMENVIENMARYLNKDALDIRLKNLYGVDVNNRTPYGQVVENNTLPEIFEKLITTSQYQKRRQEITKFNNENNGRLRGLSITPTKFGIAFTAKFLNQGNAQVNVHLDGTIQVSTGATEMGQGVNTKISQVVAHAFGIPSERVLVMPTSTEKNHNTSPTAASSGSDINCAAALQASDKIKKRLSVIAHKFFQGDKTSDITEWSVDEEVDPNRFIFNHNKIIDKKLNKEMPLTQAINLAYLNRVSLGEYAHFKTTGIGFDKKRGIGKPFNYFTNGAAVTEVEIDEYTGQAKILRTDILMDLGRSLNPGIDEGQVIGAFVQCAGWVTTEKLFYAKDRTLLSHSPTTYKIPSVQDIPRVLNLNFIENDTTTTNVHRSKAVGEPPFLLGISVFCAIKDAIQMRKQKIVNLISPATGEEIFNRLLE